MGRSWLLVCASALLLATAPVRGSEFEKLGRRLLERQAERLLRPSVPSAVPGAAPQAPQIAIQGYVARTSDGWKLVLQRYWLPGRSDGRKLPVVLCHGFGYHGDFFDLFPPVSLARHLAAAGFDVWVVDLRGAGQSNKWAPAAGGEDALVDRFVDQLAGARIPARGFVSLDPKFADWNLDDQIDKDVPAILDHVHRHTGRPCSWLGHSMGGNIMLAYLSKYGQDGRVARLATVGSQLTMPSGQLVIQFAGELLQERQSQITRRAPRPAEVFRSVNHIFFNEQNTDPAVIAALATTGHDMPSIGQIRQYLVMAQTGWLHDARRTLRYADGLGRIQCPCLIVGGWADQVAPPAVQQFLHDRIGSEHKQLVLLGRARGFRTDYGHNDALVGRSAPAEVFPLLEAWLGY